MEPIKVQVSVELNLSQDAKNFIASIVSNKAVAPAPILASAPEVSKPAVPTPEAPKPVASTSPSITIEQVRQALAAKVNGHREEIKEKLNSLGAPSVTKLDPAKYSEMFAFLNSLS